MNVVLKGYKLVRQQLYYGIFIWGNENLYSLRRNFKKIKNNWFMCLNFRFII